MSGRDPRTLFESEGLLQELKKALAERVLNAEMDHHVGQDPEQAAGNHRNGSSSKTVLADSGKLARSARSLFQIPDGNTVLYFYNPFDREVMTRVLGNIEAALLRNPRVIEIVYFNPVDADLFDASAASVCSQSRRFANQVYRVYTLKPAS